ncbi:MAG: Phosphoglycolate phosphatase [Methanomassiliicoccales archaeon PtaU1.Bin124]|nr:MAG: Phosphoglycolate phosphatase [Methanomassiliicoccales archaeon PtaU1.Bin124]
MDRPYKAIVCDVDGTITDAEKHIQAQGIEALRQAQSLGYKVMLASGNVLPVAYGLSAFIGLDGPVIAENGGVISYNEKIFRLHSGEMPWKAYQHLQEVMPGVERLFTDNWRLTEVALKRSNDLTKVRGALQGWDVEIEATGFAIHIMEKGHSKVSGVRKACDILGIGMDEVVAFGDADNDVKMLKECGYGIAVGNASPAAKAAAKYVTLGKHSAGVAEGLVYLGMITCKCSDLQ